jgi:hypothetical protein
LGLLGSNKYASCPKDKNISTANFTIHAIGGCVWAHYSNYVNFFFVKSPFQRLPTFERVGDFS